MPNHVTHVMEMSGTPEHLRELYEKVFKGSGGEGEDWFDFNSVIPMPEELDISEDSWSQMGFDSFLPEVAYRQTSTFRILRYNGLQTAKSANKFLKYQRPEAYDKGKKQFENFSKYGSRTWYNWRYTHWGTKWNSCDFGWVDDPETMINNGCMCCNFWTAWSPAEPIYIAMSEQFPHIRFEITCVDEGMAFGWQAFLHEEEDEDWRNEIDIKEAIVIVHGEDWLDEYLDYDDEDSDEEY